jgi:NAD(P)-dependent dehydrogenase (short-subunit alcohol dehydrogenase family)
MNDSAYRTALIVGAGNGISASVARQLAAIGITVGLVARNIEKLGPLIGQTGAKAFRADVSDPDQVRVLFEQVDATFGAPDIVLYNASARLPGALTSLDPAAVAQSFAVTAFGAFLVVQEAAKRMEAAGHGAILLTGATAGVKGFARSAPFAMGKFALRGLAQSAARELGPKGIHVAIFNIDGTVGPAGAPEDGRDDVLDPEAIAHTYISVLSQPRNAWTHEIDLRPWTERF